MIVDSSATLAAASGGLILCLVMPWITELIKLYERHSGTRDRKNRIRSERSRLHDSGFTAMYSDCHCIRADRSKRGFEWVLSDSRCSRTSVQAAASISLSPSRRIKQRMHSALLWPMAFPKRRCSKTMACLCMFTIQTGTKSSCMASAQGPNQAMQPTATVRLPSFHSFRDATCNSRGG
jgi:hypothetical protein